MIIGLTGPNAAGKGEVAKILMENGFVYHSLSDALRDIATERKLEHSRENLIPIGNEVRTKEGPGALGKLILEKIHKNGELASIADSIRNPKEVEELKKDPNFILIGVNTPVEVRFERAQTRGRIENAETLEAFKAIEERENSTDPNAQQLNATYAMIDKEIINDGTLEELRKKVEELLDDQT